jgi:hypothetical protein
MAFLSNWPEFSHTDHSMSQRLAVLQSMWAMQRAHTDGIERSIGDNIAMIVDAGYDGISALCADRDVVRDTATAIRGLKFVVEGLCTARSTSDLLVGVERAASLGAHHMNVQAAVHPRSLSEAVRYAEAWMRATEDAPFPVLFETHRDRLTNDLFLTLDLLDELPDLRLLADLSHYVVSREFAWPITDDTHSLIRRILDRSWAMHGRVASQHQVQIEIGNPHHRIWLDLFLDWWRYGIESWRQRAAPDDILCFTCEIGPRPYAITAADGNDTVDRWEEAVRLKAEIQDVWRTPLNPDT